MAGEAIEKAADLGLEPGQWETLEGAKLQGLSVAIYHDVFPG